MLSDQEHERYRQEMAYSHRASYASLLDWVSHDPNVVSEVRDYFSELEIPGTPSVHMARILKVVGIPEWCGTRNVLDVSVTHGDPLDGVKRSDDHIGYFEVDVPFEEIDDETVYEDVCDSCGCDRAIYVYSATHFIAGYERVYCPECQTDYYREEWS